jgi:hypothetical protein
MLLKQFTISAIATGALLASQFRVEAITPTHLSEKELLTNVLCNRNPTILGIVKEARREALNPKNKKVSQITQYNPSSGIKYVINLPEKNVKIKKTIESKVDPLTDSVSTTTVTCKL